MLLLLLIPPSVAPSYVATPYTSIPIWDELDNPQGMFSNYDVYDPGQDTQVHKQKHVDLRSFVQFDTLAPITMIYLDLLSMTTLDTQTVADLEADILIQTGERWTGNITVNKDPEHNNWRVLSMPCSPGLNITYSIFEN